jgi:hypothetical protein
MSARKAPTRGAKLVEKIRAEVDELDLDLTSTDEELLSMARTLADRLDELQGIIDRDGLMITNSKGDLRTHPAAIEQRAVNANLTRVLNGIFIGDSHAGARANGGRRNAVKQRATRRDRAQRGTSRRPGVDDAA